MHLSYPEAILTGAAHGFYIFYELEMKNKCISNNMKYIHWQEAIKITALRGNIIKQ